MSLRSLKYKEGELFVLNQLLIPHETVYEQVHTADDGWHQIRTMKVRGAPAIAIVAALSLGVELHHLLDNSPKKTKHFKNRQELVEFIEERWEHLKTSRPTAVNLFDAAIKFKELIHKEYQKDTNGSVDSLIRVYLDEAQRMLDSDIQDNKNIGKFGGDYILSHLQTDSKAKMVTICNTGSLATAGYGTALGVIRYLQEKVKLDHVFALETRPYNQGGRLTAYELVHEKINSTLITDSMAAFLMTKHNISGVVVGADRVASNGDTANKIGTYQLAIIAKHHNVPFYVCAPITSIDLNIKDGSQIPIEERNPSEVLQITGAKIEKIGHKVKESPEIGHLQIAASGINVWNPAFDVTPASLISGIVTDKGVILKKGSEQDFDIKSFLNSLK